jgi:hypothetical protein
MILRANFTEIVIAKDVRIPNEKATIMGGQDESIDNILLK